MAAIILVTAIMLLLAYLVIDYFFSSQSERILDRLNTGFQDREQDNPSLWAGAANLFQLESIRNLLYESAITRGFDIRLKKSGYKISLVQGLFIILASTLLATLIAYYYFDSTYALIAGLIVTPLICWLIISFLAAQKQKKHDDQLSGMITSLLTTMRAGGTPLQALQAISKNSSNPIKDSISNVMNNLQIGRSPNIVWKEWGSFWGTKSTRLLATGIRLKWESGGQMTTILEHILDTIEFNKRIELRVNTVTAQAKLGAWVLAALPPALAYVQYSFRPDLIEAMLNDDIGKWLFLYAGISTIVGFFWLKRIANLKP